MKVTEDFVGGAMFAEYIDWRADHPSDDLMTELLQAEFEDETGTVRRLTREELLTYITVVAGAGNETTTRLIGWTGKVLADHPDQRRELVEDRSLIPGAIEELLRFETPAPHMARVTSRDVELHGQTVPEGSIVLMLPVVGQPRRPPLSGRRPVRHPPQGRVVAHLRVRHPPLPRFRAGTARGPGGARRGPDPVSHLGGGHGPGQTGARIHRPWVGDASGRAPMSAASAEPA